MYGARQERSAYRPAVVPESGMTPHENMTTVAASLRALFECDEEYLLAEDVVGGRLVVWYARTNSRDSTAERILSTAGGHPLFRSTGALSLSGIPLTAAVRACQRVFGRYQLFLQLPPDGNQVTRGWLLCRNQYDFAIIDRTIAARIVPLLSALDRHEPAQVDTGRAPRRGRSDFATTWARLSPRERQVVDLLVAGCTAQRMGSILGISPRTVGKHLQNAYDKLGQHDRLVIAVEHQKLAELRDDGPPSRTSARSRRSDTSRAMIDQWGVRAGRRQGAPENPDETPRPGCPPA